jgi:hypothetical protein
MLLIIVNIGLGRCVVGVGTGRSGVADGFFSGVGESSISGVASGVGEATILGNGVWTGYFPLTLVSPLRVMNHAIRTPEAPRTRTIAKTHGNALLLDSARPSP